MKTPKTPQHDWSRFDSMTEAERHAAAVRDPDAQPITPENMERMRRVATYKIRHRMRTSPEDRRRSYGEYQVMNGRTIVGRHDTEKEAEAQIKRLLEGRT